MNNGPEITLTVNPACSFVYNVYNATGVMLVNGSENCPDREQGMDLFAGEEVAFEPVGMVQSMPMANGSKAARTPLNFSIPVV